MFKRFIPVSVCIIASVVVLGCQKRAVEQAESEPAEDIVVATEEVIVVTETPAVAIDAEAVLSPTQGNKVAGRVRLQQTANGVKVHVRLDGFEPNSEHGFHIHEKGDCSAPDGTSAGGHYAPNHNPHGLPPADARHAGDMGNLVADDAGRVSLDETFHNFSLEGDQTVMGRAIIVHAKPDVGAQPTGAAGARIACGVIHASKESPM